MDIGSRIRELMSLNNLTQYKLSKLSGVGQSTLSGILNDNRSPSIDTLSKLCLALKLSLSDFFSSDDDSSLFSLQNQFDKAPNLVKNIVIYSLYAANNVSVSNRLLYPTDIDPALDYHVAEGKNEYNSQQQKRIMIPVVGKAAAGHPIEMIEDQNYYSSCCSKYKLGDFAVIASGESMLNAGIKNGDRVLIRPQVDVNNGEIALVAIGDDSTIKRFYRTQDTILLKAENDSFPDQVIKIAENTDVRILGKFIEIL